MAMLAMRFATRPIKRSSTSSFEIPMRQVVQAEREQDPEFIRLRHQHSAVESAINALEAHGLDRCLDHGIDGFKRYVALAVVARNVQRLGALLRQQEAEQRARQGGPYRLAA
jgi:transposase, IS5 family